MAMVTATNVARTAIIITLPSEAATQIRGASLSFSFYTRGRFVVTTSIRCRDYRYLRA